MGLTQQHWFRKSAMPQIPSRRPDGHVTHAAGPFTRAVTPCPAQLEDGAPPSGNTASSRFSSSTPPPASSAPALTEAAALSTLSDAKYSPQHLSPRRTDSARSTSFCGTDCNIGSETWHQETSSERSCSNLGSSRTSLVSVSYQAVFLPASGPVSSSSSSCITYPGAIKKAQNTCKVAFD